MSWRSVAAIDPWNVDGRHGWVGGTGTATHIVPATGTVTVLFTQVAMTGPTPPALTREFWTHAATFSHRTGRAPTAQAS